MWHVIKNQISWSVHSVYKETQNKVFTKKDDKDEGEKTKLKKKE